MDEKLIGMLAAAAGVAETEVSDLIKTPEGVDTLSDHLELKLSKVRDDADKRATKKTRTEVEKVLKQAGVAEATFGDLPAALEALQAKASETVGSALTEEQVLKHPATVKALNQLRASQEQAVESARTEEREKLNQERAQFTKQQTDAKVRAEAERLVSDLNPNFTAGREAQQRRKLVEDLVQQGGYQLDEQGGIQLVDSDGNLLPGKMGNPVKFQDRVREYADELYGLPTSTPKDSPGISQSDVSRNTTTQFTHFKGAAPKTQAEYETLANDTDLPTPALQEVREYWNKQAAK